MLDANQTASCDKAGKAFGTRLTELYLKFLWAKRFKGVVFEAPVLQRPDMPDRKVVRCGLKSSRPPRQNRLAAGNQ